MKTTEEIIAYCKKMIRWAILKGNWDTVQEYADGQTPSSMPAPDAKLLQEYAARTIARRAKADARKIRRGEKLPEKIYAVDASMYEAPQGEPVLTTRIVRLITKKTWDYLQGRGNGPSASKVHDDGLRFFIEWGEEDMDEKLQEEFIPPARIKGKVLEFREDRNIFTGRLATPGCTKALRTWLQENNYALAGTIDAYF